MNPTAGRGRGEKLALTLAAAFAEHGLRLDVTRTPAPGEAARLAQAAAEDGYQVVVAVGGDGTVNEVANGLLGSAARLAVYPAGTGNDFARNLGYPRLREVPRFLASARERRIDVGIANGRAFVNHVGVGIDGIVAERARDLGPYVGSMIGYAFSALGAIATYRPTEMTVTIDGQERRGRYLIVLASNGVHFGAGMKAAPKAQFDDGWLDITLAGDLGIPSAVTALARLYRGTHVDGRRVQSTRAKSLQIQLSKTLPMDLDGEVTRIRSLTVELRPSALTVMAA